MKPIKETPIFSVLWLVFCLLISCTRPYSTTTPQPLPDPPPFNPDYFRSHERHYYAVKIKFKNGNFQLAENKVYKLSGRAINLKKFPSGNFKVSYFTDANRLLDEVNTASPLEITKEEGQSSFKKATVMLVDSITFFLPLHASNQAQKVKIQSHSFLPFEFPVPSDTIDVIADNRQLAPDTSVFGGGRQK